MPDQPDYQNHRERFGVTISDYSGSRHFTLKKSLRRLVLPAVLAVIGSAAANYGLHSKSADVYRHNIQLDAINAQLGKENLDHQRQARAMGKLLSEIESAGGIDTVADAGQHTALAQRTRAVRSHYREKEEEYADIYNRYLQLEATLNLQASPPANIAVRMDRAEAKARVERVLHSSIPSGFPMDSRVITSKFGKRVHPVTKRQDFHKGVDLRAKTRRDVFATADGVVREAKYSKLNGNHVIVEHNFGFDTYYAHLHKMSVKPGDMVRKGQVVGRSGNTGRSNAPHLHYEIRYLDKPVNPKAFLRWEIGSTKIFTQVEEVKWQSLINLISNRITLQTLQLSQVGAGSPEK